MSLLWILADVKYRAVPSGMVTDAAVVMPYNHSFSSHAPGEPVAVRNFIPMYLICTPEKSDFLYYGFISALPLAKTAVRLQRMDIARDLVSAVKPNRVVNEPDDMLFGGNMVLSRNRSRDGENTP